MSKQQLEALYRGALDRLTLEQLDEPWDLKCEHQQHPTQPTHHEDGPVVHVKLPCGRAGFRCSKWVEAVRIAGYCRCSCDKGPKHEWADIQVTTP